MRSTFSLALRGLPILSTIAHGAPWQEIVPRNLSTGIPSPPLPEPVEITELPMPPAIPSDASEGACTAENNPRGTGCIAQAPVLMGISFMPDGNHVVTQMTYVGAPAAPDPASIYTGQQLVLVKADGTTFDNGDTWKCITCGVSEANSVGRGDYFDYPQAFRDGKRVLAGTDIIDCGDFQLADPECTPEETHIYPLRLNVQPDGSGTGGSMREIRLNPDNVHLGWSHIDWTSASIGQQVYTGRLVFNPSPETGLPLAPRYDLTNVNLLIDPSGRSSKVFEDGHLSFDFGAIEVGEGRGFSGDGMEITYIGGAWESCNIDVFAVHLTTGKIRRLTAHPEYVDPVDISPDNQWHVVEDTRGTGRQMFIAGMRGIPPIVDILTTAAVSSTRNNGQRRFFQPWLIDRYGDRGSYFGQELNQASTGTPGSGAFDDPEWNARADPKWSLDGTRIVYYQRLTVSPECGGVNPLPCYPSTAEDGRIDRIMVANLTSRSPQPPPVVAPIPDVIPWAQLYEPGQEIPTSASIPAGNFTLAGTERGFAEVFLIQDDVTSEIVTVSVNYTNYSDDGLSFLNGYESVTAVPKPSGSSSSLSVLLWSSDIVQTGAVNGIKKTSPDGFLLSIDVQTNIFNATGTLTTTIDGVSYYQPANDT
ncbi:hypothetical protein G7Z17_g691 [Cylindrodendrum hubeiense]|uniref:Saponin hydrolase n=1 Tax=Cylindrodendrum hubeiense TaxID=595255 RepID=A0A9P5HPC2_9HYPO|nr:hypothetical protein G7Z17_g691 [Cylindrodendrum hubeiense]